MGEDDAAEVYWKALKNENPHKYGKAMRGNRELKMTGDRRGRRCVQNELKCVILSAQSLRFLTE